MGGLAILEQYAVGFGARYYADDGLIIERISVLSRNLKVADIDAIAAELGQPVDEEGMERNGA